MKTVMVFGTFDGIHPGHKHFLEAAKKLGDRLVVCLARDTVVADLKKHPPRHPEIERREALIELPEVDEVMYGDREHGSWKSVEALKPDVIAFGYDQNDLSRELTNWLKENGYLTEIVTMESFHPEMYKSSKMYD